MSPTRPNDETLQAEEDEARMPGVADREPTHEEEAAADKLTVDPEAAEHFEEMADRGAKAKGEGQIE